MTQEALKRVWEASDWPCSKRLRPFLREMARVLREHGEQRVNASVEAQLCQISPSTIDRLLRPYRRIWRRKSLSTTKPGSLLKSAIPIRTFVGGFYLNTLCAVDVASGWTACLPVWGEWQERVRQAVHHMRQRLVFPLLGIDSDNGSEFINQCFYRYSREEKITFTRSHAYKRNGSCHAEQKNGNVVRCFVGYERDASKAFFECL